MCTVLPVVGVGKGGRVLIDLPGYSKVVMLFIGAQPTFPDIPGVPLPALRRSRCGRGGSEGLTPQCTPGYGGYAPMHFTLTRYSSYLEDNDFEYDYWLCAGGRSAVNAISTQLRDFIVSGLDRWRLTV